MHEHEKRVLEGLLFLSGDEGLSIEQLNGCVEELNKKEIETVLDELMQDYLADVHGIELVRFGGIYKFVSKEAGVSITLERNDEYWGDTPILDKIIFSIIPDEMTAYQAFLQDEVDYLGTGVP